jgi:hypothetical protein
VKYTNLRSGTTTIYNFEEDPVLPDSLVKFEIRVMDCMDCHTRPSHDYEVPHHFIDDLLTSGDIPKDLPYIKKVAMDIFLNPFTSSDSAR